MKLYEVASKLPTRMSDDEIRRWMMHVTGDAFTIRPTGEVDVDGEVRISRIFIDGHQQTSIPFQFGTVTGDFDCSGSGLISLKGAPRRVSGNFRCFDTKLPSLEHAPYVVGGRFACFNTQIRSLSGINKTVGHIGTDFLGPTTPVSHVLGLILIQGLQFIRFNGGALDEILNKYLKTHDVISAQDELIDAGFKEQAKL